MWRHEVTIQERVEKYKSLLGAICKAVEPVKEYSPNNDRIKALEAIRELNTKLSEVYEVSIPVITCWVRDNSYVPETGEIFLTEPELEAFLHQYRHHLQNVERKYERLGLTMEGNRGLHRVPYENCGYLLRGEDDAIAWVKMIMELVES